MQNIKLIGIYFHEDPSNTFMVCDLHDGGEFLDPILFFPHAFTNGYNISDEGLYAVGGRIDYDSLLASYKWGIFPWFAYKKSVDVFWYCPEQRYVIFPENIHISHSMRTLLNKDKYRITINQAFREVIHNCRYNDGRDSHDGAWLGDDIEKSFLELHRAGYVKSVEVWEGEELVGGFYGFFYKGVFQGESMFSKRPSASQYGLVKLCQNPVIEGVTIKLIDTQFETPTFKRLGGEYISYLDYRNIMDD